MKKNIFMALGIVLLSLYSAVVFAQYDGALKGKKVLFVWGGWDGHEPGPCRDLFVPWLQSEGADVIVRNDLDCYADAELMGKLDLIVQVWTQGKLTGEQEKGLLDAVNNGVGLAGWHGGTGDSFRENVSFQFMVGGQWVAHPGGTVEYDVNIIDHKDPVTAGLAKKFHVKSEQYYMLVDPNVNVLATTTFSGEHAPWIDGAVIPVVWKKTYGKGRVFFNSLGHVAADFINVPESFEITKRGIRWAALSKYKPAEKWMSPAYKSK